MHLSFARLQWGNDFPCFPGGMPSSLLSDPHPEISKEETLGIRGRRQAGLVLGRGRGWTSHSLPDHGFLIFFYLFIYFFFAQAPDLRPGGGQTPSRADSSGPCPCSEPTEAHSPPKLPTSPGSNALKVHLWGWAPALGTEADNLFKEITRFQSPGRSLPMNWFLLPPSGKS